MFFARDDLKNKLEEERMRVVMVHNELFNVEGVPRARSDCPWFSDDEWESYPKSESESDDLFEDSEEEGEPPLKKRKKDL